MFYIVDKPLGISSNLVAKILKRVLKVPKIGFAGTLDPLATGLMIIGTHGSPRLFPFIENLSKTYSVTIRLDGTTSSYDLEQAVEQCNLQENIQHTLSQEKIEQKIKDYFIGDIMQTPPIYSATWISGQRAYDLARKWYSPEIKAKKRTIHAFDIVSYKWPKITADITVSHGTYIRSIARDMGIYLETGGYVEELKRTSIGHISLQNRTWERHNDISYAKISHEELFPDICRIKLSEEEKTHLRLGSTPLPTPEKDSKYFIKYDDDSYWLLEAKGWLLFPIKNVV
jgi:tRNA pseudouridine55 synthase